MKYSAALLYGLIIGQLSGLSIEKPYPEVAKLMLKRGVRTHANRADNGTKSDYVMDDNLKTAWCVKVNRKGILLFKPKLKYELDLDSINGQQSQIETTIRLPQTTPRIRRVMLTYYAAGITDKDEGKDYPAQSVRKIYEQEKVFDSKDSIVDRFSLVNTVKPKGKSGYIKIVGSIEILEISKSPAIDNASFGCIAEVQSIDMTQK